MAHNKAHTAFMIYFLKGITPVINMITERCSQFVHSLLSSFTRVVKNEKRVLMFISRIIIEMKDTVGEAPTSIFFGNNMNPNLCPQGLKPGLLDCIPTSLTK
jgi:hypothetical protein